MDSSDQNRNLYKASDDTIVGELSNEQLLAIFEEYNEDSLYARNHFKSYKKRNEIESVLEKKELEINLLQKELAIQKLQLEIERLKNK